VTPCYNGAAWSGRGTIIGAGGAGGETQAGQKAERKVSHPLAGKGRWSGQSKEVELLIGLDARSNGAEDDGA